MGACCSTVTSTPPPPELKIKPNPNQPENKNTTSIAIAASPTEQEVVKHRKSHEIDTHPDLETLKSIDQKKNPNSGINTDVSVPATTTSAGAGDVVAATVRTSSCTKEELDAILIQCGRLSRSSSGVNPASGETPTRGRRYSGSKRSFDFDTEIGSKNDGDVAPVDGDEHHRRQPREPRVSSPSSRRRSRSGSKERVSNNGGRRVSRSPNRRSESPNPNSNVSISAAGSGGSNRPGKMVSVPATDKSNNTGAGEAVSGGGGVKRIQAKRPAGEAVVVVASASRSPARANPRVALSEIDTNAKPNGEKTMNNKANNVKNNLIIDDAKTNQIVSKTQSSRLSRDLDIKPETLINPNPPSYASLLLEDIQNFHQKTPNGEKSVDEDLMEASLHKYVTVRRGGDADTEDKESSGSNSFAGSQQLSWMSSSWEPNSGDSSDCWTSKSRSDARDMGVERSGEYPRNGIGRGRVGVHGRSAYSLPNDASVASM